MHRHRQRHRPIAREPATGTAESETETEAPTETGTEAPTADPQQPWGNQAALESAGLARDPLWATLGPGWFGLTPEEGDPYGAAAFLTRR